MGSISEVLYGENPCHMETIQFFTLEANCLGKNNTASQLSKNRQQYVLY